MIPISKVYYISVITKVNNKGYNGHDKRKKGRRLSTNKFVQKLSNPNTKILYHLIVPVGTIQRRPLRTGNAKRLLGLNAERNNFKHSSLDAKRKIL